MDVATVGSQAPPSPGGVTLAHPDALPAGLAYAFAAFSVLMCSGGITRIADGEVDAGVMTVVMGGGLLWFFLVAAARARRVEPGHLELTPGAVRLRSDYDLTRPLEIPVHDIAAVHVGGDVVAGRARRLRARRRQPPNVVIRFREPRRLPLRGTPAAFRAYPGIALRVADAGAAETLLARVVRVAHAERARRMPPRMLAVAIAATTAFSSGAALTGAWAEGLVSSLPGGAGLVLLSLSGAGLLWLRRTAAASSAP